MRIYIIANDGIMLWRKAPGTFNDGEIAVGSTEELHAAPLSAKRLLALWNALPGVEKRKKVGDRDALIDQLWSAIEALPDPEPQPDPKPPSKQDVVIAMLRLPEGATVDEVPHTAPRPRSARRHACRVDRPTPLAANYINGLRSKEGKVRVRCREGQVSVTKREWSIACNAE